MTFEQARAPGADVRKDERSGVVVHYGTAGRKDEAGGGIDASGGGGRGGPTSDAEAGGPYRFPKAYRLFDAAQIEELDAAFRPEPTTPPKAGPELIPELEAFFGSVGAEVVTGGDRACCVPALDRIVLPERARFESAGAFRIADRLPAIDEPCHEAEATGDGTDFDALEDEYARLQREHEELTTGGSDERRARSGVIAHWAHDGVPLACGLIRPQDVAAEGEATPMGATGETPAAASADGETGTDEGTAPLEVPTSLAPDLLTERAIVIGAGLAADPALRVDLVLFKVVADLPDGHGMTVSWPMGVKASRGERPTASRMGWTSAPRCPSRRCPRRSTCRGGTAPGPSARASRRSARSTRT